MFALPGTPVIRYGDEIGMGDDLNLPERACARTPMQWSTEPEGGFTKNSKLVCPVINEGPYGYQHINVANQRRDPNSMLNWTERLIRMRKEAPEIGWGDFTTLNTGDEGVLGLRYDWRGNSVVILHNFHSQPVEIRLNPSIGNEGRELIDIADGASSHADDKGRHTVMLDAYGYRWYRAGGLDYLLERREI